MIATTILLITATAFCLAVLNSCDGIYNDCNDSNFDAEGAPETSSDDDGDGYVECALTNGYPWVGGTEPEYEDCDDTDAVVYPTATELCDGQYNNCSEPLYDALTPPSDEQDTDGDGYVECEEDGSTWVGDAIIGYDDCDVNSSVTYPGATEICDGLFNNCTHPLRSTSSETATYAGVVGDCYCAIILRCNGDGVDDCDADQCVDYRERREALKR